MDDERRIAESHGSSYSDGGPELDRKSELRSRGETAPPEAPYLERLLMADWTGCSGEPLTADELLTIGGSAFEPLFHEPPIGPVPEYLAPHLSVHGCIAEYEEKFEELDRWKATQLSCWLRERIGKKWCIAGKIYVLKAGDEETATPERFLFGLIEDRTECSEPTTRES